MRSVRSRFWSIPCAALGLASVPCLAQARAQRVQSAAVDEACRCRIELEHVLRIDTLTNDGAAASIFARVQENGQGHFLVAPIRPGGMIARIGPRGEILQPLAGGGLATGLGQVQDFHSTPMDSVLVLRSSDLTLLEPLGSAVRNQRLPRNVSAFRFLRLRDGRVVLNNYDPSRPAFVLLSQSLLEVRQFGQAAPRDDPMDFYANAYRLADLGDGRFAAVKEAYQYAIEIWDTTGAKVREFSGQRHWFQPWTRQQWLERGPRSPPFARVQGAFFEPPARLWVVAEVPDARTPPHVTPLRSGERARTTADMAVIPVEQYDRVFDTILEAVDIHTGRVIVSQRFDQHVRTFTDRGLLWSLLPGEDSRLAIQVWRPVILPIPQ